MKVIGSGDGKRLWMRTPDKRWIEVPYGGGQDSKIAQVNVWDGTQWVSPVWGRSMWNIDGPDTDVESLSIHAPGTSWSGRENKNAPVNTHYWNPNFQDVTGNDQFTPTHPLWLRLFYTRPRVDPTWRIVAINMALPTSTPNRTQDYDDYYGVGFWPSITSLAENFNDGVYTSTPSYVTHYTVQTQPLFMSAVHRSQAHGQYQPELNPVLDSNGTQVGMLDLASIRTKLERTYPRQGVDRTGYYHPITGMLVRRVYLHCYITMGITFSGAAGQVTVHDFDGVVFRIFARSNIATRPYPLGPVPDPTLPSTTVTYPLNIPTETHYTGAGTPVFEAVAADFTHHVITEGTPVPGRPTARYEVYQVTPYNVGATFTFEAPGENNIALYPVVVQPVGFGDQFNEYNIDFTVQVIRATIHYADPNKDTPDELHSWNSLG